MMLAASRPSACSWSGPAALPACAPKRTPSSSRRCRLNAMAPRSVWHHFILQRSLAKASAEHAAVHVSDSIQTCHVSPPQVSSLTPVRKP